MASILGATSLGIAYLAHLYHVTPREAETVVSMLARAAMGEGILYYNIQAATAVILFLAVNTSYQDFPRLSSILARDGFMPRQMANRGDRLVFSNGIVILAGLSIVLLVAFQGNTHALIPLYAVGVFLAFTLSQAGMVRHWLKEEHPAPHHILLNGLGASDDRGGDSRHRRFQVHPRGMDGYRADPAHRLGPSADQPPLSEGRRSSSPWRALGGRASARIRWWCWWRACIGGQWRRWSMPGPSRPT